MINDIVEQFAMQASHKIDEWAFSNWVTIENAKKFKMKITYWTPSYEKWDWFFTARTNTKYELYPARWRNAKKLISSITL